jgi:hypothetical protein
MRAARRAGRRRPGDREREFWDDPRHYAHELHEVADALTRGDRKLSRLSALAARHGVDFVAVADCFLLRRAVRHLQSLVRRLSRKKLV